MWALAKANLFWVLHAGQMRMPGRIDQPRLFTSYRTDAVLLHPHRRVVSERVAVRPTGAFAHAPDKDRVSAGSPTEPCRASVPHADDSSRVAHKDASLA
eukprot:4263664-Pleurochrysis_carterae.AAC.3